jgi:hypothetical protein
MRILTLRAVHNGSPFVQNQNPKSRFILIPMAYFHFFLPSNNFLDATHVWEYNKPQPARSMQHRPWTLLLYLCPIHGGGTVARQFVSLFVSYHADQQFWELFVTRFGARRALFRGDSASLSGI